MAILFAFVLIVLGILVFALKGIFGVFPDNWEWVGILLAGLGLLMGTPSLLRMIIGRPLLVACFRRGALENKRCLQITLRNVQIDKKSFWRKLGILRDTIQSLEVYFQTYEAGSNTIIQTPIRATIYDDSDGADKNRITLPPTLIPGASIYIADWDEKRGGVYLAGDILRKRIELKRGSYRIEISFVINGESKHFIIGFTVGDTADELMWVLPNPDKEDYRIV